MVTSAHIMRGDLAAYAQLQPEHVLICRDTLTCGPSDTDPTKHRLARIKYWGGLEKSLPVSRSSEFFGKEDFVKRFDNLRSEDSVLWLWINSDDWADFLFLCWTADALSDLHVKSDAVRIVLKSNAELDGLLTAENVACTMRQAPVATKDFLSIASRLWQAFASGLPRLFASLAKDLELVATDSYVRFYANLFPQFADSSLLLSPYDTCLLKGLSTSTWNRPIDIIDIITNDVFYMPYEYSRHRLLEWSSFADEVLVAKARDSTAISPWTEVSYKLTARGESLINEGVTRLSDAPPMWIGGLNVYSTWCYDSRYSSGVFIEVASGQI
jgi:hypothetical protein